MNRHALIVLIIVVFATWVQPVMAEVVVVVHPDNPIDQLTREQVIDIYMGRYTHFPDGRTAQPIDQAADSSIRADYYQKLFNKSVAQVNAFWARLLFSGRATPPKELPDVQSVNNAVAHNKATIAYIDSKDISVKSKVVFRLP